MFIYTTIHIYNVHVYILTCIHIYTYVHTYMYACIHVYMYTCIHEGELLRLRVPNRSDFFFQRVALVTPLGEEGASPIRVMADLDKFQSQIDNWLGPSQLSI